MIKYRLVCKNCQNSFDSWFASSKEFEKLKRLKHLNCHKCNSLKVEKTLMSPSVVNSKEEILSTSKDKKYLKVKNKIKEYQKFIKKNLDFVGDNFANEARSIHYNKKEKSKGIYGNATSDEISELKEEGIETEVIPWFRESDN
tara:strand:- start:765 stop:1193 length:429 start_codon:yes stop_codon:yes gene_type:complete